MPDPPSPPPAPGPPFWPPSVRPGDSGPAPVEQRGRATPPQQPPARPLRPEPLDSVGSAPPDDSWDPLAEGPSRVFPVPWRWWDAVLVFLLANLVVGTLVLGGLAAAGQLPDQEALLRASLVLSSALSLLTMLGYCRIRFPGRVGMLLGPVRSGVRAVAVGLGVGVLSTIVINYGVALLLERLGIELPPVQEEIARGLQDRAIGPFVFVSVAVLAPLAEELLFRGVLYQALRRSLPLWPSIGLSSLAFGVSHIEPVAVVGTFAVGMVFAYLFHRTGTLTSSIAAHIGFNLPSAVVLMQGAPS